MEDLSVVSSDRSAPANVGSVIENLAFWLAFSEAMFGSERTTQMLRSAIRTAEATKRLMTEPASATSSTGA